MKDEATDDAGSNAAAKGVGICQGDDDMCREIRSSIETLPLRAREVLQLVCEGHSNKKIAQALSFSEASAKGYISSIMKTLGCANRTQVALVALLCSDDVTFKDKRRVLQAALRNLRPLADE